MSRDTVRLLDKCETVRIYDARAETAKIDPLPVGAPRALSFPASSFPTFSFPAGELLVRKHDSAWRDLLDGLRVTPDLELPFNARAAGHGATGAVGSGSSALGLDIHYQPVGFWFVQAKFVEYLETSKRAPWNGDFTYSFGYDDYHPYTFSLTYANYAGNRFDPGLKDPVRLFGRGVANLSWKAPLPEVVARPFLIDETLTIDCRVGLNTTPRYDTQEGTVGHWKSFANLGCRYPFTRHLFTELNAFAYSGGQQPWDPDFTYSFGMVDYRSDHFSIIYANYSGNRFPGRRAAANTGEFGDGGLYLSWNHGF
jgi:hypothetical protein